MKWIRLAAMVGAGLVFALAAENAQAVTASGGSITNYILNGTNYVAHIFTNVATTNLTFTAGGNVEVLLVGGGGGGGQTIGGGGGGGGFFYTNSYAVTAGVYTVAVGDAGIGAPANGSTFSTDGGGKGSNSVFASLTAYGGGGGGSYNQSSSYNSDGASGGGRGAGGGAVASAYTNGQGRAGGTTAANGNGGGGGGGAGTVGTNGVSPAGAGVGGMGLPSNMSGTTRYYAGGGGGGARSPSYPSGVGGLGGGGAGNTNTGVAGTANTGGGGGAGGYGNNNASFGGASGGSGIVIVRYAPDPNLPMIANGAAQNLQPTSADLVGTLVSAGISPANVSIYWATNDGGTNVAAWLANGTYADLGWPTAGSTFTNTVTPLSPSTVYYYNFMASNASGTMWGAWVTGSPSFQTAGPPTVNNAGGATAVGLTTATLNGNLTAGTTGHVYILWGPDPARPANTNDFGVWTQGPFSTNITGLAQDTLYYYRCYATNDYGDCLAPLASFGSQGVTWDGGGDGTNWSNPTNWSGDVVPSAGNNVLFTNGSSVVRIDQDVTVNSLSVTGSFGGTLMFATGVVANLTINHDLYLKSGATILPTYVSTNGNGTGRVITVLGNATIAGAINATQQGTLNGPGAPVNQSSGSNHGGAGGNVPGTLYGSLTQPSSLGSGGGATGKEGGGAILLNVGGTLTVAGTISADGGGGGLITYCPGAGGSIWLSASNFAGGGTISAQGGVATWGDRGSGGGGRVAITYTNSTFSGTISVAGGAHASYPGQPGTLWEPQKFAALHGSLTNPANVTITGGYQYYFPDLTTNYWNLTAAAGKWFEFHSGCLAISNLVVMNSGSVLRFDRNQLGNDAFDMTNLTVFGSIVVSNAALYLSPEGVYTLGGNLAVGPGATLIAFGKTNAVNPASGGTSAKPHGLGLTVTAGGNATIAGTLTAYRLGQLNGGPGAPSGASGGCNHGGVGGQAAGTIYGSLTQPTALGSGGSAVGREGGGAIKLDVAHTLTLTGTINADGGPSTSVYPGSGGSIWLIADSFAGNGTISAQGGVSAWSDRGSAGGGRVAIEYATTPFTGAVTVAGGAHPNYRGQAGTYSVCQSVTPLAAGIDSRTLSGFSFSNGFSVAGGDGVLTTNGVMIARSITAWRPAEPRFTWSDASTRLDGATLTNTITYTLYGLPANMGVEVSTNNVSMIATNSGPSGTIRFSTVLKGPLTFTVALGGMGAADTLPPTNVTASSAYMVGSLTSTGWYNTVGVVYWGPTDGGSDVSAWSNVCVLPGPMGLGSFSTNVSLPGPGEYFYRCAASNASGIALATVSQYVLAGVTVGAIPTTICEGDNAAFWVSRGLTATSRAVTVSFVTSGTASNPGDYALTPASSITLAAGVSSGLVQLASVPDSIIESDETAILTLTSAPDSFYGVGTPGAAMVTITDRPPTAVSIAVTPTAIGERLEGADFWVSRPAGDTNWPITVSFLVSGTASNTVDYTLSYASNITLAAGASSAAVHLMSLTDTLPEPDEFVTLTLTAGPDALYVVGTPGAATLTITNSFPRQFTWTSATSGYWTNAANWAPNMVPGAGDDIFITNGAATITIDRDLAVNSLTVTGSYTGTIIFPAGVAGSLTVASNLYLRSGATIIPTYVSTNGNGTGRTITVLGDATIAGTINATQQGLLNGPGAPVTTAPGSSHGGAGGAQGGMPYGSLTQPTSLGSGGGSVGKEGGGAIKLDVGGTLTVSGTIVADGGGSVQYTPGAGGSIWLLAGTFAGGGTISAQGGVATFGDHGSGGGGRVAVTYTTSLFTGTISVAGGTNPNYPGQAGTLWEPLKFAALHGSLTNPANVTVTGGYQYYFPDLTTNFWNLTVGAGRSFEFHSGCLAISNLVLNSGSTLRFDHNLLGNDAFDMTNLTVFGSIAVSNAALYLSPEGVYALNGDLVVGPGATLTAFGKTNAINAASGGTSNKPHGLGLTLTSGGNATIAGTVTGYRLGQFSGGPGAPANANGGCTHGGVSGFTAGTNYGALTQPTALGSGGSAVGQEGGGAIKLDVAGTLTLTGTINVDGGSSLSTWPGSGGSVWLIANAFSGNGTISAQGGYATWADRGSSGGGRVAIEYAATPFTGAVSVAGGAHATYRGQPGTYMLCQSLAPVPAGVDSRTIGGLSFTNGFSVNGGDGVKTTNGVMMVRTITTWSASLPHIVWIDTSLRLDGAVLTNTATYGLLGATPMTALTAKTNDTVMFTTNVPPTGNMAFSVTLVGATKISVEGYHGSVIIIH